MSETVIFRDDVSVELIKASASDADVIWAARVSTAGEQSMDEIGEDPARSAGTDQLPCSRTPWFTIRTYLYDLLCLSSHLCIPRIHAPPHRFI